MAAAAEPEEAPLPEEEPLGEPAQIEEAPPEEAAAEEAPPTPAEAQTLAAALEAARAAGLDTLDERDWTEDEKYSLNMYQGPSHRELNVALRTNSADLFLWDHHVKNLDAVINGSRLTKSEQLFRGTILAPFQGMEPGTIVQDAAYMSTSRSFQVAAQFADDAGWGGVQSAILRINAKVGSRGVSMNKVFGTFSSMASEKELLFGRGVKLRFDGISKFNGRNIVDVTIVD